MMFAKAPQATLGVCFLVTAIPIQASTLDEDSVSPGLAPVHGASPERLHSDAPAFCGVAAVEYVSLRLGAGQPSGEEYDRLKHAEVASLLDLRLAFESVGLEAFSYEIAIDDHSAWSCLIRQLRSGLIQIVVHVQSPTPQGQSSHYLVMSDASGDKIKIVDPGSMSVGAVDRHEFFADYKLLSIQIVSRKGILSRLVPHSRRGMIAWSFLPSLALVFVLFATTRRAQGKPIR